MAIRDQIMQMAQSDPKFAQAIDAMEQAVINMPVTPEDLEEVIELLEVVVQDPSKYAEMRQAAIDDGEIDEDVLPPQFDMVYVVSLLVALYGLQDRLSQKGYARGGLSVAGRRLASKGRGGDSELAHVNPREAEMLRRAGGSGGINPATGLREFKFKWGKVLAAVAPIAISLFAPALAPALGGLLVGAGSSFAPMVGSALLGAAGSALTGGNPLIGAATGGLGAGLGSALGGALGGSLGGEAGTFFKDNSWAGNVLGSSLIGAGTAAATRRNPFSGALRGALGAGVGELAGYGAEQMGFGPGTEQAGIGRGISAGAKMFGAGLGAGMKPGEAAAAGALAGLASGVIKPSQAVVSGMQNNPATYGEAAAAGEVRQPQMIRMPDGSMGPAPNTPGILPNGRPGVYQLNNTTGFTELRPVAGSYQVRNGVSQFVPQEQGGLQGVLNAVGLGGLGGGTGGAAGGQGGQGGGLLGNLNMGTLLAGGAGLAALSGMRSAPSQAQQAVAGLPPSQQEIFSRPGVTWDWGRIQRDASTSGMSMGQYIATNFPRFTSGQYNTQPATTAPGMAQGGALSAVARFARGAGTGRSDEIDAKLSDGEYVIDAETVAMLGDGSSKAGAQRLDQMREAVRSHKGKALAKGKFSPDAKSPLSYLKGVA
jgi:hypothetical protein